MNLSTTFLGKKFPNPVVLASGILGVTGAGMASVVKNGCGGVTAKSLAVEPRPGHPNPTVISNENFMINAIGLSGEGLNHAEKEFEIYKAKCPDNPLIVSVISKTIDGFKEVTKRANLTPADLLEVNISCPNVEDEFGRSFAALAETTLAVTKIVKANSNLPVIIKLSPNVTSVVEIAKAVEKGGADAINMGNTLGPGMVIDTHFRKPVLANKMGGVSGPGLKPITVKNVWQIYQSTKLPIIATGGILTGNDAIEMFLAGASLVGVGSGVYYQGIEIFQKINEEITEYMEKENVTKIEDLIGLAHKQS